MNNDEPEAYQIGHVPFLGVTVFLDSHPLIPRTETEWWVEQLVKSSELRVESELRVLDLFAGSGCVGLAVLKHVPNAHVTFGEFTAQHLPTIEKNIRENGFDPRRATVVQTDVWSAVPGMFDLVLANPPYLSRARLDRIEASVLDHEPIEALFAEDDGFALIDATIQELPTHLVSGGAAWIEHEPEHSSRINTLCGRLSLPSTTHQDQYGLERYSVILKP